MTKWEYKAIYLDVDDFSLNEAEERLNQLGREGWELVRVPPPLPGVTTFCIFKRPLVESVPQNVFMISEPGSTISRVEIIFDDDDASEWDYDDTSGRFNVWRKLDSDERMRD